MISMKRAVSIMRTTNIIWVGKVKHFLNKFAINLPTCNVYFNVILFELHDANVYVYEKKT